MISQVFFPLLFVLFGMVLAVTGPSRDQDDPSRVLTIENSVLYGGNVSVFYAQVGEPSEESILPFTVRILNYTKVMTSTFNNVLSITGF